MASDFHTQAEAVAWAKKKVGKKLDYDNFPADNPYQCWDLVKYYYVYLGNGGYARGNAEAFVKNKLPSGWKRVTSDPKPGDIVVWGSNTMVTKGWNTGKYGHLGIVVGVNGGKMTTVEQNTDGKGAACKTSTRDVSSATCFIRPDFKAEKLLTISYNANGGTIDSATYQMTADGMVQKKGKDVITAWGYGTGNDKKGLYNASSFGLIRDGYAFAGWSLSQDGSATIFDQDDTSLRAETVYPQVKDGSASVTLYAIWRPAEYTLRCYYNGSGKNYLYGSDFSGGADPNWWQSRDTAVAAISADSEERHNGYNSLKIVNTSAGSSGKDLAIQTMTQGNRKDNKYVGDNKPMTLSFWAKSSNDGTNIFFRWGHESLESYRCVTLTTNWEYYTVSMDKTEACGQWFHPYADSAGTVWLSELQLEDGSAGTDFVPETGGMYTSVTQRAQAGYDLPEAPFRDGYTFSGWYTAVNGGEEITASTPVRNGNFAVYARWSEGHAHSYTAEVTAPTCTEDGFTTYTCDSCGNSYESDRVPALGHSYEGGVCVRCGEIDESFIGVIEDIMEGIEGLPVLPADGA